MATPCGILVLPICGQQFGPAPTLRSPPGDMLLSVRMEPPTPRGCVQYPLVTNRAKADIKSAGSQATPVQEGHGF